MSTLIPRNDERITRRAAAGDERAFAAIFERYQERLYRYCLSLVGDPHDAQEALQNTMLKVLRALPGEERQIELRPWLYRIAHNESIELLRRRRPTESIEPETVASGAGLAEEAEQRQRLAALLADLGQLPERQRGALVMRELGGLDFEQIGAALGTSAATARQTLYEARLGLREIEAGREMRCEEVTRAISDGDGRVLRRRDIRAHLRSCPACRLFREEIAGRERDLAALMPLPAVAVAAMLKGLLGGGASGAGAGTGGAVGVGAAKTIAGSTLIKGAATVAAVAAIGLGAADRGGLVHLGSGGGDATTPAAESTPAAASGAGASGGEPAGGAGASSGARGDAALRGQPAAVGAASGNRNATAGGEEPSDSPSEPATTGLPAASSHGQETAATHRASGGAHPAHPAHPQHPTHPDHPQHPSQTTGKSSHPAKPPKPATAKPAKPPHPEPPAHPERSERGSSAQVSPEPQEQASGEEAAGAENGKGKGRS